MQLMITELVQRRHWNLISTEANENWTSCILKREMVNDLILKFCDCSLEYLDFWEESFDTPLLFNYINLCSVPKWNEVGLKFVKHSRESWVERTYLMNFVFKNIVGLTIEKGYSKSRWKDRTCKNTEGEILIHFR